MGSHRYCKPYLHDHSKSSCQRISSNIPHRKQLCFRMLKQAGHSRDLRTIYADLESDTEMLVSVG